jgi:hypothetical protein
MLADYHKRFEAAPGRLLDTDKEAPSEYHDGLTVAKTSTLAIDEAAKLHPAAEPLIVHAAFLTPESIPHILFSQAREKFGEPLCSALEGDGLDEVVAALRAFAREIRSMPIAACAAAARRHPVIVHGEHIAYEKTTHIKASSGARPSTRYP